MFLKVTNSIVTVLAGKKGNKKLSNTHATKHWLKVTIKIMKQSYFTARYFHTLTLHQPILQWLTTLHLSDLADIFFLHSSEALYLQHHRRHWVRLPISTIKKNKIRSKSIVFLFYIYRFQYYSRELHVQRLNV